jgi:hypothetical protein
MLKDPMFARETWTGAGPARQIRFSTQAPPSIIGGRKVKTALGPLQGEEGFTIGFSETYLLRLIKLAASLDTGFTLYCLTALGPAVATLDNHAALAVIMPMRLD